MKTSDNEPRLDKEAFNCPFCNVYANFRWNIVNISVPKGDRALPYKVAQCAHCAQWSLWTYEQGINENQEIKNQQESKNQWGQTQEYLRLGRGEGDRQVAYQQLFEIAISINDLSEIRECTHKGWALGGDRFREQIEVLGKRRETSKGVGRPRKSINRV